MLKGVNASKDWNIQNSHGYAENYLALPYLPHVHVWNAGYDQMSTEVHSEYTWKLLYDHFRPWIIMRLLRNIWWLRFIGRRFHPKRRFIKFYLVVLDVLIEFSSSSGVSFDTTYVNADSLFMTSAVKAGRLGKESASGKVRSWPRTEILLLGEIKTFIKLLSYGD